MAMKSGALEAFVNKNNIVLKRVEGKVILSNLWEDIAVYLLFPSFRICFILFCRRKF